MRVLIPKVSITPALRVFETKPRRVKTRFMVHPVWSLPMGTKKVVRMPNARKRSSRRGTPWRIPSKVSTWTLSPMTLSHSVFIH